MRFDFNPFFNPGENLPWDRIKRGDARASVDLLSDIGEALGVDPKWFFPTRSGASFNERTFVVRGAARRPLSDLYARNVGELGFALIWSGVPNARNQDGLDKVVDGVGAALGPARSRLQSAPAPAPGAGCRWRRRCS